MATRIQLPAGLQIIYQPRGRAREYADYAANLYRGCDHRCLYCWSPSVLRMSREEFHRPVARPDVLAKLRRDADKCRAAGFTGQILLCFTCDPYSGLDVELAITRQAIRIIKAAGMSVCVLTKGGSRALRDIDLFGPGDAFGTTLTFLPRNDHLSREWEPGAASPADRIETILRFHDAGIPTWVSLEPVLDPAEALDIIWFTKGVVDHFKVGVLNYHPLAETIDWGAFAHQVRGRLESLGKSYTIKADLRKHLAE